MNKALVIVLLISLIFGFQTAAFAQNTSSTGPYGFYVDYPEGWRATTMDWNFYLTYPDTGYIMVSVFKISKGYQNVKLVIDHWKAGYSGKDLLKGKKTKFSAKHLKAIGGVEDAARAMREVVFSDGSSSMGGIDVYKFDGKYYVVQYMVIKTKWAKMKQQTLDIVNSFRLGFDDMPAETEPLEYGVEM